MTAGIDLKVERVRARITVTDLAHAMGVSRQRISQVEAMPRPTESMCERYRAAIVQVARAAEVSSL